MDLKWPMDSRVLLLYPNADGYPGAPLSLAQLSGVLKSRGVTVDILDFTFCVSDYKDDLSRNKLKTVMVFDKGRYYNFRKESLFNKIRSKILDFNPEVVGITVLENNYWLVQKLIGYIKKVSPRVKIVVGGIFPTVAEHCFTKLDIDAICVGDGEIGFFEYLEFLSGFRSSDNVNGFLIKNGSSWIKNLNAKVYNWQDKIFADIDLLDDRHFLKPFMGRIYNTGFFEISRGCPFECSYCINKILKKKTYGLNYHREKELNFAVDEISHYHKSRKFELIYFCDENFMMMSEKRFGKFESLWKEKINLPFLIQTKAESLLNKNKVARLKEVGCITASLGVEVGNEDIRIGLLGKTSKNTYFKQSVANCNNAGLRTTANLIMGLPFETEGSILETIDFCKEIEVPSITVSYFAPYYGTDLRKICLENGLIEDKYYKNISVNDKSLLKKHMISKRKQNFYYRNIQRLIYGV
jgi:anaerobic magnesium-protoporphyrin IX monomethyl ester cyclase